MYVKEGKEIFDSLHTLAQAIVGSLTGISESYQFLP
jgi:hypothetical protein